MTLERAVEVAIGLAVSDRSLMDDETAAEADEAAATLRAWLPFIKAADIEYAYLAEDGPVDGARIARQHDATMAAYRAFKEASK